MCNISARLVLTASEVKYSHLTDGGTEGVRKSSNLLKAKHKSEVGFERGVSSPSPTLPATF